MNETLVADATRKQKNNSSERVRRRPLLSDSASKTSS
jgi:hypothetical protein